MSAPTDYADGAGYGQERKTPCFDDEGKWWIYVTAVGWMACGPGLPKNGEFDEEVFDTFDEACVYVGHRIDQEIGERRTGW